MEINYDSILSQLEFVADEISAAVTAGKASRKDFLVRNAMDEILRACGKTVPQRTGSTITVLDSTPEVHVVISSDGDTKALFGGPNFALAKHLNLVGAMETSDIPVTKSDTMISVGQDVYQVDRDYFLAIRGMFFNPTWKDLRVIDRVIPETAKLSLVVSY